VRLGILLSPRGLECSVQSGGLSLTRPRPRHHTIITPLGKRIACGDRPVDLEFINLLLKLNNLSAFD
jgi:hypothetical protein